MLAQLVERGAFNPTVTGSSPVRSIHFFYHFVNDKKCIPIKMAVVVDFRPIGINLQLDHLSEDYISQLAIANTLFAGAIPNVTRISDNVDISKLNRFGNKFIEHTMIQDSYISINGKNYYIKDTTIKSGANGTINIVSENKDLTGIEYILKTVFCNNQDIIDYEGAIKEAMINHTLYTHNNTNTNRLVTVASTFIDLQLVVFVVQEKLEITLNNLVRNLPANASRVDITIQAITQVTAILKSLWSDDLQFNHCDLKPDNIMRGTDGNFRLIDFGLSHLKNGMYVCKTPGLALYNSQLRPTKDLSALIWYILYYCNPGFGAPLLAFFKDCLRMTGGVDLNTVINNWAFVLEVTNSQDNTKTNVTTFASKLAAVSLASAGGYTRRKTKKLSKKLSKKLTKKNSKHKMKGGLVQSLTRTTPNSVTTNSVTTNSIRRRNKKEVPMDENLKLYLSTYSVEHLLTYIRFEKGINDKDTLLEYLSGKTYPGINRTNTTTIDPSKNKEQMIDLFLEQTNPDDAQRLLRVLLQFPIHNGDITYYNKYIEDWNKVKDMETTDLSIKNDLLNFNLYAENKKY